MKSNRITAQALSAVAAALLVMGSAQAQDQPEAAPLTLTAAPNGAVEVRNADNQPIANFLSNGDVQVPALAPTDAETQFVCARAGGTLSGCEAHAAGVGEQGPAGIQGIQGVPGVPGVPGAPGPRGFQGCYADLAGAPADDPDPQLCQKGANGKDGIAAITMKRDTAHSGNGNFRAEMTISCGPGMVAIGGGLISFKADRGITLSDKKIEENRNAAFDTLSEPEKEDFSKWYIKAYAAGPAVWGGYTITGYAVCAVVQ